MCVLLFFPPKEQQKSIQHTICPKDILQKLPLVNKHHYKYSMLLHGLGSDTKKIRQYLNFHFLYLRNRTTLEVCFSKLRSFFFSFSITRRKNSSQHFFSDKTLHIYTIYDEGRRTCAGALGQNQLPTTASIYLCVIPKKSTYKGQMGRSFYNSSLWTLTKNLHSLTC